MDHGKPSEGMECACCMEDIDEGNYVEYRTGEGERETGGSKQSVRLLLLVLLPWPLFPRP